MIAAAASPVMPAGTDQSGNLELHDDVAEGSRYSKKNDSDYGAYFNYTAVGNGVCEIDEENSTDLFEIREDQLESSVFSLDVRKGEDDIEEEDCVYVAVGKSETETETSMNALLWTLRDIVAQGKLAATTVYLVHIFPETHFIPSPLGNLPVSNVSPEQVETHKAQERGKRREFLQEFINTCVSSYVRVDTILIESDAAVKAILELIPVVNIRKLVLGTTKSDLKRLRSKKGNGIADQILRKAPEYCDVKIICEGKEVSLLSEQASESPAVSPRNPDQVDESKLMQGDENQCKDYFSCMCFKPKTVS